MVERSQIHPLRWADTMPIAHFYIHALRGSKSGAVSVSMLNSCMSRTVLKRIDPASLTLEAARTKSYTVKVRLNAIQQVARGKPLAVVERRVKVRSGVVADWVRRYVHSGYKALAA